MPPNRHVESTARRANKLKQGSDRRGSHRINPVDHLHHSNPPGDRVTALMPFSWLEMHPSMRWPEMIYAGRLIAGIGERVRFEGIPTSHFKTK